MDLALVGVLAVTAILLLARILVVVLLLNSEHLFLLVIRTRWLLVLAAMGLYRG